MISQKIQSLFEFINFLDKNKEEYIQKYIPICEKIKKFKIEQNLLKPQENYIDKQEYDKIQNQIKIDFSEIKSNIYLPITNKLKELNIWSGDETYVSIFNNNITAISDFKRNFTSEDIFKIFHFKKKYINFRSETDTDFLCLSLVFSLIDEILKELFDFFKDSNKNEFEKFESEVIEVDSLEEIIKGLRENNKNIQYSISKRALYKDTDKREVQSKFINIKQKIIMGDNIEAKHISNKNGSISIGKKNISETNNKDDFKEKSFKWQKWGIIIATILALIIIVITLSLA